MVQMNHLIILLMTCIVKPSFQCSGCCESNPAFLVYGTELGHHWSFKVHPVKLLPVAQFSLVPLSWSSLKQVETSCLFMEISQEGKNLQCWGVNPKDEKGGFPEVHPEESEVTETIFLSPSRVPGLGDGGRRV